MTDTPKTRVRAFLALALVLPLALSFAGCKNFMKSDEDVKKTMEEEVEVANAPQVSVRVQSSSDSLGSVTPNGQATFKVNVPSNVLASELAGGFIKWAAFYSGDLASEVPNAVTFADPKAKETAATVLVNRPDVVIKAIFEVRPTVSMYFPNPLDGDSFRNAPIQITFTKPINETSIGLEAGASSGPTSALKNVTVLETFMGVSADITTSKYQTFTLSADKKTLALILPNDPAKFLEADKKVNVTVSKNIVDSSGLQMAADYTFMFKIGSNIDNTAPILSEIVAGTTTAYLFDAADAAMRRIGNVPVFLRLRGGDVGGGVSYAEITPTLKVYGPSGDFQKSVEYAKKLIPWASDADTPTSFAAAELANAGSAEDGLITLSVVLYDLNINHTDPINYSFVRDTTAPSVDDAQIGRIKLTGSASSGYYNKNSTITFSETNPATDPILDAGYAGGGSVPRLNSSHANIKYRFGFNNTSFASWTAWTPVTSSVGLPISSFGSAESPNVPVYVQLMDDLGNTSLVKLKTSIAIDNTPPSGSVTFTLTEASGKKITQDTANVPFAITASDGMSGVAKYYVTETDLPSAPDKNDAGWKAYTPVSGAVQDTITFVTQGSGDGIKTVYVWLMDNAENITASALTAVAYKDGTKPTVSDFFLRAASPVDVNGSGTPVNPNATQYSNTKTFYFAFIADDGAGGIGLSKFNYTDSAGGDSEDFRILANSAPQGTVPLQVSNIAVAQIGTTSAWRVFGKLTVKETEDVHSITVKVKDFANNESVGLTNIDATNRCIYDSTAPEVTAVNLMYDASHNCFNPSGFTFFTKDDTNTLYVTANDRGSGTVSGLQNATLAAVTAGTYSALPSLTFTGLEGLTNPGTASASLSFAAGAVDGPKALVVTPRDYAGNTNPVTVYIYRDTAKPTVELWLRSAAGDVVYKDDGSPVAYPSSAQAVSFSDSTYVSLRPIAVDQPVTNGAGLKEITYQLYKQTRDSSGVLQSPVSQGAPYSGTLTGSIFTDLPIPAGSASANWIYGVRATDNVGNVGDEERIGFTFDRTPPTVVATDGGNGVRVTVYQAGDPNTKNVATFMNMRIPGTVDPVNCYVLPVQAFVDVGANATPGVNYASQPIYVYIRATDRPASDRSGSGIATTKNTFGYYHLNGTTYVAPAPYTNAATESSEVNESSRYVLLPCSSTQPYWSMSSYSSIAFAPTVIDAVGNQSTAAGIRVAIDTGIPTASLSYSTYAGNEDSVQYVNGSSTFAFTPTDPVDGYAYTHVKSGIKAYQFSSSPTRPAANDVDWKPCTEGLSNIVSTDFRNHVTATSASVYLYLLDNAGNCGTYDLGNLEKDAAMPTYLIDGVVDENGRDAYTNGDFYFIKTLKYRPMIECHDLVSGKGSGLATCTLSDLGYFGTGFDTNNPSVVRPVVEGINTIDGPSADAWWTVHTGYGYMAFRFILKDNAQNGTANVDSLSTDDLEASDLKVVYDNVAPTIAAYSTDVIFTNVSSGAQRNVSTNSTCVIKPTDPLGTYGKPASGVKSWMIKRDDTGIPDETDPAWKTASAASIDISAEFNGLVTSGACSVYLFLKDNVGNRSGPIDLGDGKQFVKDASTPVVTINPMAQTYKGGSGGSSYFVRGTASITFTASDFASSGLSRYLISVSDSETSASVAASPNSFSGDGTATAVSVGPIDVHGFFDAADARTVYLYVADKAGNLASCPIVTANNAQAGTAVQATLDETAPNVSSAVLASGNAYDADGILPVRINLGAADGSGVKVITLTGGVSTDLNNEANRNAITVKANTDAANLAIDTCVYAPGSLTITLDEPCVASGYLTVANMRVGSTDASVQTLTARLTDAVGYSGTTAQDSVTIDSSAPNIGTVTLAAQPVVTAGWTNSTSVVMTIPQTDVGSRVQKIEISGSGFETLGSATFTVGSTTVTPTVSGGTVTLVAPADSGSDIRINGLQLKSTSGKKDLHVVLTDGAGNSDGGAVADTSIDLDENAPSAPGVTIGATGSFQNGSTWYLSGLTADITLSGPEAANGHVASGWDHYYYTVGVLTAQTTISNGALTVFASGDSAGKTYVYHFHQIDKAGHPSVSKDITFIKDATGPVISSSLVAPTTGSIGVNGGSYYAQGAKITIAASDSTTGGSGVVSYAISSAANAASVSGSNSLKTTGDGRTNWIGSSQDIDFTSIINGSALTLYVWDNLGNVTSAPIVYLANGPLPWNKDVIAPTLSLATSDIPTVSPRYASFTGNQTVYVNGTGITLTATGDDGTGSGISGITASGAGTVSGNDVTLPAGSTYTVTVTDRVGLSKAINVTVTADTAKPAITFDTGSVTGSTSTRQVSVTVSDSPSGVFSLESTAGSVSYTAGNGTGTVTGIAGDSVCKFTTTDNVGNTSSKWCFIQSDWPTVVNCVDVPEMWTISPSGSDYTITATGAACKTWEITTSTDGSTGKSGTTSSISATLPAGSYKLKMTDWQSGPTVPQPHLVVLFTIGSGTVSSPSVLGSVGIAARLSPETITTSARRESFNRARSSSRTNLPVWYAETGAPTASTGTKRTGAVSVNAERPATPARAGTAISGETLRSTALSAMKGLSGSVSRSPDKSPTMVKDRTESMDKTGTTDLAETFFVMIAPEGSPAFVACARGIAALRQDGERSRALSAGGYAGFASDGGIGEKPEGLWEKFLAFFGFGAHDRGRNGIDRIVFASE